MADYISVEELAKMYGVTYETARVWCKTGKVKAKHVGKKWFIHKKDLEGGEHDK